jgi:hypothetical protein
VVCNTGVSLIPTLDGITHHFVVTGVYDALFVMRDTETSTLWNHITGEALYGPLLGRRLLLSNLEQMNVKEALAIDPNMGVAISSRPFTGGGNRLSDDSKLSAKFIGTLATEDTRRPRMELGLGIWSGEIHRYYPMQTIRQRGDAFMDRIANRKVLIYIDPATASPAALFTSAKEATRNGKEIDLDTGAVIRSGVLLGRDGKPQPVERPQQVFTRWYGFALTFPGTEVFGQ